jgi:hypothetical protein
MKSFHVYQQAIASCLRCAAICNYCATNCLLQNDANQMATCIQLTRECAYVCTAAAQVMSLGGTTIDSISELVEKICNSCSDECFKYNLEHCSECADVCRRTITECKNARLKKNVVNN